MDGEASRAGALVDALGHPSETRRLLTGWARSMARPDGTWDAATIDWFARALSERRLRGRLWTGPGGDEAVGIAVGTEPGEVGGRVEALYLDEGFRAAPSLRTFLDRLDAGDAFGPIVELPDPAPAAAGAVAREEFRVRGFVPVERADLRYPPARPVFPVPAVDGVRVRPLVPGDAEGLARLNARAYADNPVDVALFRVRRDALEDARAHIAMLFGTEVGPWLPDGSFVAEDAAGILGATIANDRDGVLITQVMVDPRARRQGHAARLLSATLSGLRAVGRTDVRLVVTRTNRRAERLYRSLGFELDEANRGFSWLNADRLELSDDDLTGT